MIFSILAFFRGYLQVRFWGRDVERYLNLSTLAVIPLNEGERKKKKKARRR